jgi:hypothetical protein
VQNIPQVSRKETKADKNGRVSGFELARNPERILEKFRLAIRLALNAKSNGSAAVVAAWETGAMLRKVRAFLPSRQFAPWLLEVFGDELSRRTAYRWIELSVSPVAQIESCSSVTEAYVACGILPETAPKKSEPDMSKVDVYATLRSRITGPAKRVVALLDDVDIATLPREQRLMLREELEPFKRVWEALA